MAQKPTKAELQSELETAKQRIAELERLMEAKGGRYASENIPSGSKEQTANEALIRLWADAFQYCAHGIALGSPATGKVLTCNPAFAKLQGRTVDEISSMTILSMYAPESHEHVKQAIMEADRKGSHCYEADMIRKDGTRYPVQMDLVSVRDSSGNILYRVATQQDITERKATEDALRESEAHYRLIAENSADVIWVLDPTSGKFTYVSPSVEKLRGFTPEEVMAQPVNEALTPESLKIVSDSLQTNLPAFLAKGSGTESFINEVDQPCKDGSIVHTEVTTTYLFNEQGKVEIVGVSRDITERKKAEQERAKLIERLNLATRSAHMGIWDWDIQKNEIGWDDQMYALYGLQPGEFGGAYEAWLHGVHPEDRESSNAVSAAAVRGEREYDTEFRVLWPDGSVHWLKADGEVIRDAEGKPSRMVGVNYDITARKQAEEKLRESEAKYRSLINSQESAISTIDVEGVFHYINANGAAPFGDPEFVIGKKLGDLFPPHIADWQLMQVRQVIASGQGLVTEYHSQVAGKPSWRRVSIQPIFDAEGRVTLATINSLDITERKQVENRLSASERRYRQLFENMNNGFVLFEVVQDEQGLPVDLLILAGNTGFEKTTGLDLSEAIGKRLTQVLPGIENDAADWIGTYGTVALTGEPRQFEQGSERLGYFYSVSAFQAEPGQCAVTFLDITERKLAEAELKESEERFSTAFFTNPVSQSIIAQESNDILAVNDACCRLFGYSREELIGTKAATLNLWEDPADRRAALEELQQTGRLQLQETTVRVKSGEIRTIMVAIEPILWKGFSCLISSIFDITDRKVVERLLQESEHNYRELVQNANSAIIRWKSDGTIIFFNEYAQDFFGYRPEEIIGQTVGILVPQTDSTGGDLSTLVQNIVDHPEQFVNVVNENICRDGRRVWMAWTNKPVLNENGEVTEILAVGGDITERKKAEEQLRASEAKFKAVFDNAPVGISLLDPERKLLESNEMLSRIIRISKEGLAGGQYRNRKYIREDGTEIPVSELASTRAIVEHQIVRDVLNGIIMENGEVIWTQVSAAPLGLPDPRIVVITQDITKRKQAEMQLRITLEELRRSNAELEQFAYIASHDLQEPLRSMAGMVQLLQRRYQGQLDERADEYIGHAVEAAGRMQSLINDLLAFSRVDRRGAPLAPVTMDACIAAALKNLDAAVRENSAEVTWDEMPTVVADEAQLTQLLQNLIGNGIKFKGEEPPHIHIGAQKLQNAWQFSVHDNGIGIEPQYFERIFLLFQRLHTRREYPGTGIGLALCKKIVERHDGTIWVESNPGKGSTFHFTIPFRSTL